MARLVAGGGEASEALAPIPEPRRARAELREIAGEDPARARELVAEQVTRRCWRAWGPALRGLGMRRSAFAAVVTEDGRETWLWVMGDRQWDDLVEALAGRALRRVPARRPRG